MEFKVGDRVIIGGNKLGVVIDNKEKFENMVSVFEDGAEYACWVEKIGLKLVKNTDQQKIEELEKRIEKLEKCVMGEQNSLEKSANVSNFEKMTLTKGNIEDLRYWREIGYKWACKDEKGSIHIFKIKPIVYNIEELLKGECGNEN